MAPTAVNKDRGIFQGEPASNKAVERQQSNRIPVEHIHEHIDNSIIHVSVGRQNNGWVHGLVETRGMGVCISIRGGTKNVNSMIYHNSFFTISNA